jgi:hypothetical protein
MKKGVLFLAISLVFAQNIKIINGTSKFINFNLLYKYSHTLLTKSFFDAQKQKYTFVSLSVIKKLYCPNSKEIKFSAIDGYSTTFNLSEIKDKKIVFAFKSNNKNIKISEKGPAKIIYLYNKEPLKEIFLIDEVICVK